MATVEVDFAADNPGQWVTHCHNLYHQNAGMTIVSYQVYSEVTEPSGPGPGTRSWPGLGWLRGRLRWVTTASSRVGGWSLAEPRMVVAIEGTHRSGAVRARAPTPCGAGA